MLTLRDARRTEDERNASMVDFNKYLTEDAWGVPIVWMTYPWVMTDKVGNFSTKMDYATTRGSVTRGT